MAVAPTKQIPRDKTRVRARRMRRLQQELTGYAFALPAILMIFTFMIFPLGYSLYLSLTKFNFVYDTRPLYIGFENYLELFRNGETQAALGNTLQFALVFFPALLAGGLVLAVLIENARRGKSFFRTAVFLPVIVASSISGVMFIWIFNEQIGLLNFVLGFVLRLPQLEHRWLIETGPIITGALGRIVPSIFNPSVVLSSIVGVSLWKQLGIAVVIFLSGLQAIPNDLYDAARVDGANALQQFWYITIPNLREAFLLVAIWGFIQAFKVFDLPYVMTKGGPGTATTTLYLSLWRNAFTFFQMGFASALGYFIAVLILAASAVSQRLTRAEAQ